MLRLRLCLNFKSISQPGLPALLLGLLQGLRCVAPAAWHGCSSVIQISLALILFYIIKQFHQINLKWFVFVTQFSTAAATAAARHAPTSGKCCQHVGNIFSYSYSSAAPRAPFAPARCDANGKVHASSVFKRCSILFIFLFLFAFRWLLADWLPLPADGARGSTPLPPHPCVVAPAPCCMFTLQHFSFNALAMTLTRRLWRWLKSLLCLSLSLSPPLSCLLY